MPASDPRHLFFMTTSLFLLAAATLGCSRGASYHVAALADAEQEVRREAVENLIEMGEEAVPALVVALDDTELRPRVLGILQQIGGPASGATPALLEIAKSDVPERTQAIAALGAIGAAQAASALAEAVEDDSPAVRSSAVIALGRIGPVDEAVVPALVTALSDADLRPSALSALGRCGDAAKEAVPALIALFSDEGAEGRDLARVALTLDQLGPVAEPAVPTLVSALEHDNYLVASAAASALGSIGPPAESAVPALIEAVKRPAAPSEGEGGFGGDWAVPRSATAALGKIGPAARDALPTLQEALDHRDEDVREYAGIAIRRIEGGPAADNPPE